MGVASVIGAGVAIGSAVRGGKKSRQYADKARKELDNYEDFVTNDFINQNWKPYYQTEEAQAALSNFWDVAQKEMNTQRGAQVINGVTDWGAVQQNANDLGSDVLRGITSQATENRNSLRNSYNTAMANIADQRYQSYMNQSAQAAKAGSAGMKAGMDLVAADMKSKSSSGKGLLESAFGGSGKSGIFKALASKFGKG